MGKQTREGAQPGEGSTDRDGGWLLLGLDGEMSSAELAEGGKLIQVGCAVWTGEPGGNIDTYTSLIRWDEMQWSPRAAQVHGITREEVQNARNRQVVDDEFHAWLTQHGAIQGRRILIPIGLNVAAFDMPFFRDALPKSTALFARRAVDLNALCFTYAGWDPNPRTTGPRDFSGWKKSMKAAANKELLARGTPTAEHDAGYDAAQALLGWWWLRTQLSEMTQALGKLTTHVEQGNPLRAALGEGLYQRTREIPEEQLKQIMGCIPPRSKRTPMVWQTHTRIRALTVRTH
jgi:hypothetical protein